MRRPIHFVWFSRVSGVVEKIAIYVVLVGQIEGPRKMFQ